MKYLLVSISLSALLLFGLTQVIFAQDATLSEEKEPSGMAGWTFYDDLLDLNETYLVLVSLLKEERFQEALPYLDKILEIDTNNVPILLNKGSVLIALDRSNESLTYFDRLLKIEPNHIKGLTSKAAALANIGEHQKALDLYEKILTIDKDNEKIMNAKAKLINVTPTVSTHGAIGEDNFESKYDIHLRVTVRNSQGELTSVAESSSGRYIPLSFTDEIFEIFFEERKIIEIDGEKYEKGVFSESYIAESESIGIYFYEVTMNDHEITVFATFPPRVGIEPTDEIYAEWTIARKVV